MTDTELQVSEQQIQLDELQESSKCAASQEEGNYMDRGCINVFQYVNIPLVGICVSLCVLCLAPCNKTFLSRP